MAIRARKRDWEIIELQSERKRIRLGGVNTELARCILELREEIKRLKAKKPKEE